MKKSHIVLVVLSIIVVLIGTEFIYLNKPVVHDEKGVSYYLRPGTGKKTLLAELSALKIISFPRLLAFYMYFYPNTTLKTGEYFFKKGSSPISIWHQVISGKGFLLYPFTIVPGSTFAQLRQNLAQARGLKLLTAKLTGNQIMQRLGSTQVSAEGEFFPETYYYTRDLPDLVILQRAYDLMQKRLADAWLGRAKDLPYQNVYEALTAASLIEKEAYLPAEQPIIAGVLVNRLRKNMLLQFDPTVIYGLGERYAGKLHKSDLSDDNVFNTYLYKGLPPSPIAMPSMTAILAALHPTNHEYYYFVARGDGSHQFSKTLPEHQEAVSNSIKNQTSFFNESRVFYYLQKKLFNSFDTLV